MIKKFQQGGQQQQQLDQIFAMINQQPEEALKQLVQSGAKPEDIAKIVQVGVQQGKINPEIGKSIMQALQGQVSAARHGMKLQYIKSLKHQCADDEELYYYKKGGSVGCGCKKKEEGGEVEKAKKGCKAVENFKAIKKGQKGPKDTLKFKDQAARDSFYINTHGAEDLESTRPGSYKKNKDGKIQWTPDRTKAPYNNQKTKKQERRREEPFEPKVTRPKPGNKSMIVSSYQSSYLKQGDKVIDKFKARCGSKMKKK